MREMGWSYQELLDTPYEQFLKTRRIVNIEKKEEKRQKEQQKKEAQKHKP